MKKRLLTRLLSITLVFTILFSDISVYAASDVIEEGISKQTLTEDVADERQETEANLEEINSEEAVQEEAAKEESAEEENVVEEPVTEEKGDEETTEEAETEQEEETPIDSNQENETEQQAIMKDEVESVYYFVPKTETSAIAMGMYSLEDGKVSLKESTAVAWIDRLNLTNAEEIKDFYDLLVEASDNDGTDDFLIDDSNFTTAKNLTVKEITKSMEVKISDASNNDILAKEIKTAVGEQAASIFDNYSPYMLAVRDAFDRDHPEVFWLSGETVLGYSCGYQYTMPASTANTATVSYTVHLSMALKGTVNNESFDVRAENYQSETTIKSAISSVDSACEEILSQVSTSNDYEKIKYFNEILTTTNEYNTSVNLDAIDHDCRECTSALEGKTGTAGPVCEGYARAFKVLCDKAGIPCVLVDGKARTSTSDEEGSAHMWNYVQLGNNWYGVDVTWNDPVGGSGAISKDENEKWLLVGADTIVSGMTFAASHPVENSVSANGVKFTNGPELYSKSYEIPKVPEEPKEPENTTYQVILHTNGGTINTGSITEYDKNTGVTLPTDVIKDGYIFDGWYANETFEGDKVSKIPIGSEGDKTFYAKWKIINTYTDRILKDNGEPYTGYFQYDENYYYANKNGILQSGWIKVGNVWRFFDENNSFREIPCKSTDGSLYVLENGNISYFSGKTTLLKNGWQTVLGVRYYFDDNGFAVKGWFQNGRYCYYAETEQTATDDSPIGNVVRGIKEIDGKIYGFHPTQYYRLTGWQTLNGERYFFQEDCSAVIGWYREGNYWYYADKNGCMAKGVTSIESTDEKFYKYYFDNNYRLATGWFKINNQWKFFDLAENPSDCHELAYTGYDGSVSGWAVLSDGRKSYIHTRNGILKGWQTIEGQRYYFDSIGIMETGEFKVGNNWYYAEPDNTVENGKVIPQGAVAKGIKVIDGETYCFHPSGYYRLTGWQTIDKKRFFLGSDGKAVTGLFETGGRKYYAETESDEAAGTIKGMVVTGAKKIGDITYVFHPSQYYMLTGWQTVNGQRYYIKEDGNAVVNAWYQEGDYWYHADETGGMAKGLVTIGDKQYFFDNNYRLSTGWKNINGTMYFFDYVAEEPEKCCAVSYTGNIGGWITLHEENARKSYINTRKQVLTGWQTIEGKRYYFDSTGIMKTGLLQIGRNYYYAQELGTVSADSPEGTIARGAKLIDGKIYGFHPTQYYRLTGWQTLDGARYFFRDDCSAVTGWYREGNYWYYADENGHMAKGLTTIRMSDRETRQYYFDSNYRLATGWFKINNQWKFFDSRENHLDCYELTYTGYDGSVSGWAVFSDGRKSYIHTRNGILKGWQTIDGQRYYFDSIGIMETGEFKVGNNWYYAEPANTVENGKAILQGAVAKGIKVIDGETYCYHPSGYYRLTGWQTVDKKRFFLASDGKAVTGLFETGGRKYYAETENNEAAGIIKGTVVTGAKKVGDITYVFHPSQYYMLTGWQTVNGQRYYIKEDGNAVVNAWYQEGDYWYHADETGSMSKGLVTIGDKQYFFDNNYRLSTGWKNINGTMYFFDYVAEEPEKCCSLEYTGKVGGWITLSDNHKSYINTRKQVLTGWQTIEGKRYYFDSTGILKTGLFQIGRNYYYAQELGTASADSTEGTIARGAKLIDGKIYGFHPTQYYRLTGWQTLDGARYFFRDDCSAVTGWYREGNYWYYADEDGRMAKGLTTIVMSDEEARQYYFDSNYRLNTGWITISGVRYHFNLADKPEDCYEIYSGNVAKGWFEFEGKKSYFNSSLVAVKGWQTISGQRYYFTADGVLQTGWFEVDGYYYYANFDGMVVKGLVELPYGNEKKTYYFDGNYRLKTGWQTINGKKYFFEIALHPEECYASNSIQEMKSGWLELENDLRCYVNNQGKLLTGWQTIQGQRYYFDVNGVLQTGWFKVGNNTYFGEPEVENGEKQEVPVGSVAKGVKNIGEETYFFHPSQYYMLTGFQTFNGKRYYLQKDGTARTGWFSVGTDLYYGEPDSTDSGVLKGTLAAGAREIGGNTYFFHTSSNYRLTGWQTVNGQRYYLNEDGTAKTGWFTVSGKIYYGEPTTTEAGVLKGTLAKGAKVIGGETYIFHTGSYYRLTGWQTVNNQRFYLNADGKARTGWFKVSGKSYYAQELIKADGSLKGTVAKGLTQIQKTVDDKSVTETYYFHPSQYYMLTGWQTMNRERYYFNQDGVMETGWFEVSGYHYYAKPDGTIVKGLVELPYGDTDEKKTYYFDGNYRLKTGWQTIGGKKYFFENATKPEDCYATNRTLEIKTGWLDLENGQRCYVNSRGTILTGWQTISSQRYYFDANGVLQIGWFKVGNSWYYGEERDVESGAVAKGIKVIDGKTYCFHPSSYYRMTGWQTVSGQRFYLDSEGVAKTGWFKVGNNTYYAEETTHDGIWQGTVAKGAKSITTIENVMENGEMVNKTMTDTYFFHTSQYYMLTGFQTLNGKRYYLQKNGRAKTGWFIVGTDLYYGEPDSTDSGILKGTLAAGAREIGGNTYFFHTSSNYRLTGWQTVNGQRYYLNEDGTAKTGWFTVSGKIYYGEPTTTETGVLKGTLAKGAREIGGETYVFHTSSYYRLTGWQTVNNQRFYLNADGKARTGWFKVSGKTYYAQPDTREDGSLKGTVAKGLTQIQKMESESTVTESYYFHPSQYYMLTGWQTINRERYYFNTEGVMETGWFEVSGYHYYAKPDGTIVKGLVELPYGDTDEKKTYYFDGNYRLKTGWQTISGKKYFFENATKPEDCYATNTTLEIKTGWLDLENGQRCYVNSKGTILTGWQTISGQRYYFDTNGVLQIGWFKVGNSWYYGEERTAESQNQTVPVGVVAKGIKVIDGKTYCFHTSSYYRLTGWQTVSGQRFYLDSEGVAKTGWFKVGNNTYYAEESTHDGIYEGTVAKGAKAIGTHVDGQEVTETYFFHTSQYYMLTGFQTFNGKRYYLQKDGTARTGWFSVGTDLYYGEPDSTDSGVLKGTLAAGAREIGGNTYFFHTSSNYRLTGWQTVNGQRYYLNEDGTAKNGWFTVSGKIYYGEPTTTETGVLKGTLAKGAREIGGETYVFHTSSFYRLTGWQTVNNQRFYLNADGKARTGWFKVSGYHYYAKPDGTIVKGLVELPYGDTGEKKIYYFDGNYRLKTGWQTISGKKYFFRPAEKAEDCYATYEGSVDAGWMTMENGEICYADSRGNMKTGWQTINGQRYYFDANGVLQLGWFKVGNNNYYAEPKMADSKDQVIPAGAVAKGIKVIDGKTYCFHTSSYYMLKGWQTISGQRFYLDNDGVAKTGWFKAGNNTYYAEESTHDGIYQGTVAKGAKSITKHETVMENGEMVNKTVTDTYLFHSSQYYMLTGFQTFNGKRYYLQKDGTAKTGWFSVGTDLYYGELATKGGLLKGALASGAKEIEETVGETIVKNTYFFHTSSNYRLIGWQTVNGQRYYLDTNGKAKSGWFKQNGYWYYGEENTTGDILKGAVAKGLKKIVAGEGDTAVERTYYFDTNYRLSSGWKTIGNIRYFFNADQDPAKCYMLYSGAALKGWYTFEDGRKSYFNSQGNVLTGWQTISGKKYYFDTYGIMQTGWCTINGTDYFFNADGIYIPMTVPTIASITSNGYGTVDVKWNQIDGVQSYTLEYSKNNVFPSWETTSVTVTDTSLNVYTIGELEPGATYYFRIKYTAWGGTKENPQALHSQYSAVKSVVVRGEVAATSTSAVLSECKILSGTRNDGITVQLKASLKDRIKSADDQYYIVETESYGNAIDLPEPVSSVDKAFEIETGIVIDGGEGSDFVRDCVNRALMNKFALAILKDDGTYQVISAPMGITNPEAITENSKEIFTAMSKKGLQGISYAGNGSGIHDARNANTKQTLFNVNLAECVASGEKAGFHAYEYKGKTYYFSDLSDLIGNVKSLNAGYRQYMNGHDGTTKVSVTFCLLLGYKSSNSYLIDPAARTPGHRYYTLNVREEKARETYEALFCYLGETFGKDDCYVTNWILGNEVNSSRAWNYQGSLSFDAYMQSYATAFRLLYNGVKTAKIGNNVYISLDNGWTAAPDTYAGKSTLDKFAAYAQTENPDMLWSIAYHGYSYPLTRCDFWNDGSNTTNSLSTRYISMKNIYVLTDYAATLEQKYDKPSGSIRVILSEQGYNAGQGAEIQARALARGYYMAEFNDRIDAFIIRAIMDDRDETSGGLYLGILNRYEEKRISFYVYEYMDSDLDLFAKTPPYTISTGNEGKVRTAQNILCNTNWDSIVPNFSGEKLAGMY